MSLDEGRNKETASEKEGPEEEREEGNQELDGERGGIMEGQNHPSPLPPGLAHPAVPSEWLVHSAPLPLCHLSPSARPHVTRASAKCDMLAPGPFLSRCPHNLHAPTLSPSPCQLSPWAGLPWARCWPLLSSLCVRSAGMGGLGATCTLRTLQRRSLYLPSSSASTHQLDAVLILWRSPVHVNSMHPL